MVVGFSFIFFCCRIAYISLDLYLLYFCIVRLSKFLSFFLFSFLKMLSFNIVSLALGLALTVSGANIQVQVGKTGLTFDPVTINANVGDSVTYNFFPKVSLLHWWAARGFADYLRPESFGSAIVISRSMPPTCSRFLFGFRANSRYNYGFPHDMDHSSQWYEANMGLLCSDSRKSLPVGDGSRY